MRIGCFTSEKAKRVILLLQRVPEDCPRNEDNYPGTDPTARIKEIESAGYKVLPVWWKDVQGDTGKFKAIVDKFMTANYHPEMNA